MEPMLVWAINLFVLSIGIFIVGMIKPKWILFWAEHPNRLMIQFIVVPLLMGALVLYGEGNRAEKSHQKAAKNKTVAETPVLVKKEEQEKK
ncbi:MAG: hypothetical protein QM500_16610 [Methylococcales bacterium]